MLLIWTCVKFCLLIVYIIFDFCLVWEAFENIVEKGENASKKHSTPLNFVVPYRVNISGSVYHLNISKFSQSFLIKACNTRVTIWFTSGPSCGVEN